MVMSGADKAIYAYRNGNPIGRARVEICGRGALGDHVFSLLEATTGRMSSLVPGPGQALADQGSDCPFQGLLE
jgi:hypothetical protein